MIVSRCFVIVPLMLAAACGGSPSPKPPPEPAMDARQANELALQAFDAGRYHEAVAGFRRAERLFRSIDDPQGVAATAISAAETHLLFGERAHATAALRRAREAAERTDNVSLLERAQLLHARLLRERDPAAARRKLNGLRNAAPAIATQARLLLCELELDAGATQCLAGLAADDALTNAHIARLRARGAMLNGNPETAMAQLERALNIYRALAYRPGLAATHAALAETLASESDIPAAREHLEHALFLRLWMHDRAGSAALFGRLAKLSEESADSERYRQRQKMLLDKTAEPEWNALLEDVFGKSTEYLDTSKPDY